MVQVQMNVVLVLAYTTTLTDLHGHGTRHHITRGQILGGGSVPLHESLALGVAKNSSLSTAPLSDETASAIDTGRVELHKLGVHERNTSSQGHGGTITSASVCRCAGEVSATVSTCGQHGVLGLHAMDGTVLHVHAHDSNTGAVTHNEVQSEVLNEVGGIEGQRATVQGVQHGMTGTIRSSTTSVSLTTLSVIQRLTTEGSLVDLARLSSGEGHAVRLQLEHSTGSLSAHVVNGVLISEPVRTLDSVVHMPLPVVLCHVSESGIDASLRSHSVGPGGEQLRHTGGSKTSLGTAHGRAQSSSSSSDHHSVVLVVNNGVVGRQILVLNTIDTANNEVSGCVEVEFRTQFQGLGG
mmetsp:Transcript_7895/g.13313  ORF Transcript_7895/g.13313 Transcript_7895/m.13313 type:complete len:352 (+) Transcript_7895:1043-2098(+)